MRCTSGRMSQVFGEFYFSQSFSRSRFNINLIKTDCIIDQSLICVGAAHDGVMIFLTRP